MESQQKGYIGILLLVIIAFSFILTGGFLPIFQQPDPSAQKYVLVDPSFVAQNNTLQLQNLQFVKASCDPGYLKSGEPFILYAAYPAPNQVAGPNDKIKLWYRDELAITLGEGAVSPMVNHPADHVSSPQVGDITKRDPFGFPPFPSLFITDVTFDANSTIGDATHNGTPFVPNDVYGAWKAANGDDPPRNGTNLAGGDPLPSQPTIQHSGGENRDANKLYYSAEIVWNISALNLTPGHSYRAQFVVHDGDSNTAGGDLGIGCSTIQL